jgi:hypothetical protein
MGEAHAADKLQSEKVGQLHDWLTEHAPQQADAMIGARLAKLGSDPEQNARLVTDLHSKTGSDAVLVAFLSTDAATANAETYLPLIDKISDPRTRNEIREQFEMAGDSIQSIHPGDPR